MESVHLVFGSVLVILIGSMIVLAGLAVVSAASAVPEGDGEAEFITLLLLVPLAGLGPLVYMMVGAYVSLLRGPSLDGEF